MPSICHGNSRFCTSENGVLMFPMPSSRRSIITIRPAKRHMLTTCATVK